LEKFSKGRYLLRRNNPNSFTSYFERAWEFGTGVMETEVPT